MIMDNFMDKLVERINSQGSVRTQSMMGNDHKREKAANKEQLEQMENRMTERLADFEDKLAKTFADNVVEAVKESNARYVEMMTQYKQDNDEGRLSANEELMAALASSREANRENSQSQLDVLKAEISEHVHNETVRCYRNIQAVVEQSEAKLAAEARSIAEMYKPKSVKGLVIFSLIISLLNLAGFVVLLLWMLRII